MNTQALTPRAIEKALREKLLEILGGIAWLQQVDVSANPAEYARAFDLLAIFEMPSGTRVELWIDCHADPRPAQFPYVSLKREFDGKTIKSIRARVFAAPYLSPRMREVCESHGWSWYDMAGNCRISVPGILHLERTGESPVHQRPKPVANLGTKEAGRVIRTLLSPYYGADKEWTQRALIMNCRPNVSLGLVNKVVRHLREEGYIETLEDGGFKLKEPAKLLMAWRDAYRFDQHERLDYFTLLQGRDLRRALGRFDAEVGSSAYAAFTAADFLAPHVRQPKTWLYVMSHVLDRFAGIVQAKRVDTGGNMVVLVTSDEGVLFQPETNKASLEHEMSCTSPQQTYVDLWHCGGRGREAAEAVLNQRILPVWKAAGLNS